MFRNPLTDSLLALVVLLLIFGPKRLPPLGRSLGHGIREFRDSIGNQANSDGVEQPALMPAQATTAAPGQAAAPAQAPSQQ
jgi:sec-independent protein translocase protein TatA